MKEMADNCLVIQTCILLHNFALTKGDEIEHETFLEIQQQITDRLQLEEQQQQQRLNNNQVDQIEVADHIIRAEGQRFRQYIVDRHFRF